MNMEFLKGLGLNDDTCAAILEEHGKAVKEAAADEQARLLAEQRKREAVARMLEKAGVARSSFRRELLKSWDVDTVELEVAGGIKNEAALIACVKTDYPDFISTETLEGMPCCTPPTSHDEKRGNGDRVNKIAMAYHAEHYGAHKEPL